MERKNQHFYMSGYTMEVAPGRRAQCDIFFKLIGNKIDIRGVDLFDSENNYLGFIPPHNLSFFYRDSILGYLQDHRKQWRTAHVSFNKQPETLAFPEV